jgi:energy-coupling factor transporter ATP-binding protein EcfA2
VIPGYGYRSLHSFLVFLEEAEVISKEEVVREASELIKDRRFLFRAGKKIGELGLVGEVSNRLIVFLAALTTMIVDQKRRTSVVVTGPSGSGKTTLIELPLMLVPPEFIVRRASFTRQALAYGEESLDNKILFVEEYRGGAEAQYLLRLLQSQGEIAHERTVGGTTEVMRRLGSPVVLTTTTEETSFEDNATRFLPIAIDATKEQNQDVLKAEIGPRLEGEEPEIEVWQEAIQLLKNRYQPFIFPPWFSYIAEQVPAENVRARRDWKRFLGLLEAVAMCSPDPEREGKITFADYCVAYRVLNSALTATNHAVNEYELRLQTAVEELHRELRRAATIREVRDRLGWDASMTYKHVGAAVRHKLVEYEQGTHAKNVKRLLPIGGTGTFLPHPELVFKTLKELGPSVVYADPISGKPRKGRRVRKSSSVR